MGELANIGQNKTFDLSPKNLQEAMEFADILSRSSIIPKDFAGNPGNILVAVQWGMELGLKPMQAMQNIAVINGRPSLWGDAVIALVRGSSLCEYVYEEVKDGIAYCRVKRKGEDEQVRTFSEQEAQNAGLLKKAGPWTQYKNRMLQLRARAFALRDVFPDILKGMPIAEEIRDSQDYSPVERVEDEPKAIEYYPQERFDINFPKWEDAIKTGKRTADQIITSVSSKATLSQEQLDQINAVEAPK